MKRPALWIAIAVLVILILLAIRFVSVNSTSVTVSEGTTADLPLPERAYQDGWQALSHFDLDAARSLESGPPADLIYAFDLMLQADYSSAKEAAEPFLASPDERVWSFARDILLNSCIATGRYGDALALMPTLSELAEISVPSHVADSSNRVLMETWADAPPPAWDDVTEPVDLPMKRNLSGHAMVPVILRGQEIWFTLDTGADFSVVTDQLAGELGLEVGEQWATSETATSLEVGIGALVIDTLSVGGVTLTHHRAYVVKHEDLEFSLGPIKLVAIRGILGWNALQHLPLEIDFEHKVVRILPTQRSDSTFERNLFWAGLSMPIVELRSQENFPLHLFLDLGANKTILYSHVKEWMDLPIARTKTVKVGGAGGFEEQSREIVENVSLYCGHSKLAFSGLGIAPTDKSEGQWVTSDGVAGFDLAGDGRILLDIPNGRFEVFSHSVP